MLHHILGVLAVGKGFKITVSTATINETQSDPTDARAYIIFNTDGTVDQQKIGEQTQINASSDWIIPNDAAANVLTDYEVGYDTLVGDAFDFEAAASGAFVDLSSNRTWGVDQTVAGSKNTTAVFYIRNVRTSQVVDSATITFDITVE
jgi:hypothetical protein